MNRRLTLPFSNGKSHAPRIITSPGCTHSGVIVIFWTHQPQLPQDLRHHDDRDTRDQTVEGAPTWQVLKPKMGMVRVHSRSYDLGEGECDQNCVEPALHRTTMPASFRTGAGYIPNTRLARALKTKGMTIQGTS